MYNLVSADKCKVIDIKNGTIYRTLDRPTYFGEKKTTIKSEERGSFWLAEGLRLMVYRNA